MVLLCTLIPTARMLQIPLPSFLSVESLIFYLPSISSSFDQFPSILIRDFNVCNPDILCCNQFFFFYLRFPVFQNIYIKILKYNSIDILCFPYLMLFWNCLIFFFNGGCAPFLIPDDLIPIISFTDFQHFFTDIKSIGNDADWKSGKVLLYFCCYPFKRFPFTILLYFFIT